MAKYHDVPTGVINHVIGNKIKNEFLMVEHNDHRFDLYFVDMKGNTKSISKNNEQVTHHISSNDVTPADALYPQLSDFVTYIADTKYDNSIFTFTGTSNPGDEALITIGRFGGVNHVLSTRVYQPLQAVTKFEATSNLTLAVGERYNISYTFFKNGDMPELTITGETTGPISLLGKGNMEYNGSSLPILPDTFNNGDYANTLPASLRLNGVECDPFKLVVNETATSITISNTDFSSGMGVGNLTIGNVISLAFVGDRHFEI